MRVLLTTSGMLERLRAAGVPCSPESLYRAQREAVIPPFRTARGDFLFDLPAAVAVFRAVQARRARRGAHLRKLERTCP